MTKQSFAKECDINEIVRKFGVTGELPQNVRMPTFGDFTTVSDFKSAMDAIALAHEAFDAMPAEWRTRFDNDPQKFLEFTSDEDNREEAIRMGMVPASSRRVPTDKGAGPTGATEAQNASKGVVADPPKPPKGEPG